MRLTAQAPCLTACSPKAAVTVAGRAHLGRCCTPDAELWAVDRRKLYSGHLRSHVTMVLILLLVEGSASMLSHSLQGTSDEVALLVAEFALLDGPIAALAEDVDKGEAGAINEDELARLAVEIPDLRMRLGIG